ncbi:MAG: hypothetical protein ACI8ZO_000114 [Flavobacteriales bacterium]
MIKELKYVFVALLLTLGAEVFSQGTFSNLRQLCVPVNVGDTVVLDQNSLDSLSLQIISGSANFKLLPWEGKMVILDSENATDSLCLQFQVYPFNLAAPYFHKSTSFIQDTLLLYNPGIRYNGVLGNAAPNNSLLEGLQKSGSISRSIRSGSNQNVSFDAGLDLQFSGMIDDETEIRAVISDRNLPIQADGYTQQLQEFDQVYMQMMRPNAKWTGGDYVLQEQESYFGNYQKKASGIRYESVNKDTSAWQTEASIALSRGKFTRNQFLAVEGNQGPYRLRGAANEFFIIVLSGSERVYVDGVLLKRGLDQDYVIDYNAAEITFMPRQLMTRNKRISVEFEYSSRNYARLLMQSKIGRTQEKFSWNVNAISQQDAKNQTIQQELGFEQKQLLSEAGDDLSGAYQSAVDSVGYTADEIRYAKKEFNGISIYVYSTDPDSAHFALRFTQLGLGKGNYKLVSSEVNGKVFEFVPPVNGTPQASYEPIAVLIAPTKHQLITANGVWKPSGKAQLKVDVAVSNFDANTFSVLDVADNVGSALKIEYGHTITGEKSTLTVSPELAFVQDNFRSIERFRAVEFARNLNLNDTILNQTQLFYGANISWRLKQNLETSYGYKRINFGDSYEGSYQNLVLDGSGTKWKLNSVSSINEANFGVVNSKFIRSKFDISHSWDQVKLGVFGDGEQNNLKQNKTLLNSSFYYTNWEAYASQGDSSKLEYRLGYGERKDRISDSIGWQDFSLAQEAKLGIKGGTYGKKFGLQGTYRKLQPLTDSLNLEQNLLARINWNLSFLKSTLRWNSFIETGAGLEPKREFGYVKVGNGQGQYSWYDYNNNGIQELGEFEQPPLADTASYIRVFTPTTEYISVSTEKWSQQLSISPGAAWSNKKGLKKFLSLWSNQFSWQADRKSRKADVFQVQVFKDADSLTVTMNNNFNNRLMFRPTNWQLEWLYTDQKRQSTFVYGTDGQNEYGHTLQYRNQSFSGLIISGKVQSVVSETYSDALMTRNFLLEKTNVSQEVQYALGSGFILKGTYVYSDQKNRSETGEQILRQSGTLQLDWQNKKQGLLSLKGSFIQNDFIGNGFSSVAYQMLEGLRVGQNITWAFSWQKNLSDNLRFSLNYEGRSAIDIPVIHTGNVEMKVFF